MRQVLRILFWLAWPLIVWGLVSGAILLLSGKPAQAQTQYLLDDQGGRLTTDRGEYLLAQDITPPVPPVAPVHPGASMTLRTWGDPHTTGRMLSFNIYVSDDKKTLTLMGYGIDGTSPVKSIQLLANTKQIATCPRDICNFEWPVSSMIAGNNDLAMITTHADGSRYQIFVKFGKP